MRMNIQNDFLPTKMTLLVLVGLLFMVNCSCSDKTTPPQIRKQQVTKQIKTDNTISDNIEGLFPDIALPPEDSRRSYSDCVAACNRMPHYFGQICKRYCLDKFDPQGREKRRLQDKAEIEKAERAEEKRKRAVAKANQEELDRRQMAVPQAINQDQAPDKIAQAAMNKIIQAAIGRLKYEDHTDIKVQQIGIGKPVMSFIAQHNPIAVYCVKCTSRHKPNRSFPPAVIVSVAQSGSIYVITPNVIFTSNSSLDSGLTSFIELWDNTCPFDIK
jgi:hypothetical protein